jgi:hypothetical protein
MPVGKEQAARLQDGLTESGNAMFRAEQSPCLDWPAPCFNTELLFIERPPGRLAPSEAVLRLNKDALFCL